MGHQGIAINDMCEEDKIEGLHLVFLLGLQVVGGCLCMGVGVHHKVMR